MKQKAMMNENHLKDFILHSSLSGNKANMFSINLNESHFHRYTKWRVCEELVRAGWTFFTEPKFKNGYGRPDIVAFFKGKGVIIEVVHSESEESLNRKSVKYPTEFDLEIIKCDEPLEKQLYFL